MRTLRTSIAAAVAAVATLTAGAAALAGHGATSAKPLRLADATLIVEVNATAGDAGLQVFLDGEPWKSMRISDPNGRTILDVAAKARLDGYGLTELFSESSEPPFDTFPLAKFKALFPAGRYSFDGTTIEGRRVTGSARLTHRIPAGPKIVSPRGGSAVERTGVVARWEAVARSGVTVTGYRAIVTREDPLRILSVDLPASSRSVQIPEAFLQSGTAYKLEVQAIAKGGNQTLTEVEFRVK